VIEETQDATSFRISPRSRVYCWELEQAEIKAGRDRAGHALRKARRNGKNGRTMIPILAGVNWQSVGREVVHQQRNREQYTPVISLYRWWARRPHALIGAILDAAVKVQGKKDLRVSDPFSGGGTVAFEAVRRGLPVYAQDLYPWPTIGLTVGLSMCPKDEFLVAASRLLEDLDPLRSSYRRLDGRELTHILRVRVGSCPRCNESIHLFPFRMISLVSRNGSENQALFGCRSCGGIHIGIQNATDWKCTTCGRRNNASEQVAGGFTCPHCSFSTRPRGFLSREPEWSPVAVQELKVVGGRARAVLRPVERGDPVDSPQASKVLPGMRKRIPDGIETHRLLESAFKAWGDLYTARQADVLVSALRRIKNLNVSEACRDRLAMAIIGTAEIPAFLSRWDRFHLKAFEGLANHRYSDTTLVVEINPLSPVGRGTLPHRLASAKKALDWALRELSPSLRVKQVSGLLGRIEASKDVIVATGNSTRQALKNGTVDLVLTDPPYYDDVQYGELARLFHFWFAKYRLLPKFEENEEAVPNRYRGKGADFYVESIAACFKESRRTLAPTGRLILTFHNKMG